MDKPLSIPRNAKIPIKIGSGFLVRMQQLMLFILQDKTKEELQELHQLIKDNKITDGTWQYHYTTIAILVAALEKQAISEGLTIPTPEDVL